MITHRLMKIANMIASAAIQACSTDEAIHAVLQEHPLDRTEIEQVRALLCDLAEEHAHCFAYHARQEREARQ